MNKMLISLACFAFLIGLSGSVSTQPIVEWANIYDGGANDWAWGLAVDGSGNVYVAGESWLGSNKTDYYIIKYDSSGSVLWTRTYDGESHYDVAWNVAVDGSGNVYVAGTSTLSGSYDYYIIKYDSSGSVLWTRTYDGGSTDHAFGVAVDGSGNVYVTGTTSYPSAADYYTIKYDSSGNVLWTRTYDGGAIDVATGVAVDGSGNVYVTGYSYFGGFDYYTIKYDSSGNVLWTSTYDGGATDYANGVAVDGSGNVYVTGTSNLSGSNDYYTIKYDSSGNEIEYFTYDSSGNKLRNFTYDGGSIDFANDVAVDGSGNVYVTGKSYLGGNYDYYTIKYDSCGNVLWSMTYDGGDTDRANGVAVDGSGNVYVTGISKLGSNDDYYTIKYAEITGPDGNGAGDACEVILATIDIRPDPLKLKSHGMMHPGRWITAYIELPEGYDVADINISTVLLNDTISAELRPAYIGDYDRDDIPDLTVKFDGTNIEDLIDVPTEIIELTLTGTVAGMEFIGTDTIRVIEKGKKGNKKK